MSAYINIKKKKKNIIGKRSTVNSSMALYILLQVKFDVTKTCYYNSTIPSIS